MFDQAAFTINVARLKTVIDYRNRGVALDRVQGLRREHSAECCVGAPLPCTNQKSIAVDDQGYLEEMLVQEIKNRVDKAMTPEQFTQVVDAILDGKYSWACVLILRFAGYNPLHYIPYRTYNRLMKENNDLRQQEGSRRDEKEQQPETKLLRNCFNRLENLSCLEVLDEKSEKICGGDSSYFSHHSWKLCLKDHWR